MYPLVYQIKVGRTYSVDVFYTFLTDELSFIDGQFGLLFVLMNDDEKVKQFAIMATGKNEHSVVLVFVLLLY